MPNIVKSMPGICSAAALFGMLSIPAYAADHGAVVAGSARDGVHASGGHCPVKARGYVLAAAPTACSPGRHPARTGAEANPVRGRDALLHFRSGDQRPRMTRASVDEWVGRGWSA